MSDPDPDVSPKIVVPQSVSSSEQQTAGTSEVSPNREMPFVGDPSGVPGTRMRQLLEFVERADRQVGRTSTKSALSLLASGGLVLVLLPAVTVFIAGTFRFPQEDYMITSLIGAVLLVGSVVGFVVDSRGRSRDLTKLTQAAVDHDAHLQESWAKAEAAKATAEATRRAVP
ncbi:hypothetical protein [Nocardia macrotermitis]|uniref:Holin-X, holin superfamily III n=1 Tax=Nocardia macrotermitis TaxID=2585198 RepID=A0A7K0DFA4_9NOCA|nr:hypothetical protein [Nocardia macrotermitis]MQY24358.1 hypothetical protein [Nocardia macrotermitis]